MSEFRNKYNLKIALMMVEDKKLYCVQKDVSLQMDAVKQLLRHNSETNNTASEVCEHFLLKNET